MSAHLSLENFAALNVEESSRLAADVTNVATAFAVESGIGFLADKWIAVGPLGGEQTEVRRVVSVSSNTITINAAFTNAHSKFEPITQLFGDQIQVYRATNVDGSIPADASFSTLVNSPVAIQPDQMQTPFTDATGGTGYWYKIAYRHSISGDETDLGSSVGVRGGDYQHYVSIQDVRIAAGMKDANFVPDQQIAAARQEAESEVNLALSSFYTVPFASVPAVIKRVVKFLAAGYLLLEEYGTTSEGTNKDGERKLALGRELLDRIRSGDIVLSDDYGTVLGQRSAISGWPNDSTATAAETNAGGDVMFRIGKVF